MCTAGHWAADDRLDTEGFSSWYNNVENEQLNDIVENEKFNEIKWMTSLGLARLKHEVETTPEE